MKKKPHWSRVLRLLGACERGLLYARKFKSPRAMILASETDDHAAANVRWLADKLGMNDHSRCGSYYGDGSPACCREVRKPWKLKVPALREALKKKLGR